LPDLPAVLDDYEHRIFRYHFVLGADWRLCTRMLKMDRGNFFHIVYRIQQKVGRAFAETDPIRSFRYRNTSTWRSASRSAAADPPVRRQPNFKRLTLPLSA
jgi:hypothetical protein